MVLLRKAPARIDPSSISAASKRFGRYGHEQHKYARDADIQKSETLQILQRILERSSVFADDYYHGTYQNILAKVQRVSYTAEDVERFSLLLADIQDDDDFECKAGLMLSALVNNGTGKDYAIRLPPLPERLQFIGYLLSKNLSVVGDVGKYCGLRMGSGNLTIDGDADYDLGVNMGGGRILVRGDADDGAGKSMENGTIIVEGNAGWGFGYRMSGGDLHAHGDVGSQAAAKMSGGSIVIEGNTGGDVGNSMAGGTLHLFGDEPQISGSIQGGRIFHKGKLIFDK